MTMKLNTLVYHDVVSGTNYDASGFAGANAAEYKLQLKEFENHLEAIQVSLRGPMICEYDPCNKHHNGIPVLLTFDDGGVSSYSHIAPMLEAHGWLGYFFVTTDYIDRPAFMSRNQITELHQRGHVIGSHSCSHPEKMSDCSQEQLLDEWHRSLSILAEIIDQPVTVASVPGGFYSRKVAEAAHRCGVRTLFTSEPVQKVGVVDGCRIVGRFSIIRGMGENAAAEFAAGNRIRRLRQYSYWNLKKTAKAVTGPVYPWIRTHYLARK